MLIDETAWKGISLRCLIILHQPEKRRMNLVEFAFNVFELSLSRVTIELSLTWVWVGFRLDVNWVDLNLNFSLSLGWDWDEVKLIFSLIISLYRSQLNQRVTLIQYDVIIVKPYKADIIKHESSSLPTFVTNVWKKRIYLLLITRSCVYFPK